MRRDALEMEVHELRKKIEHLDKALDHLMPLADMGIFVPDINDLGLTDAVRRVLTSCANQRFSASDVRKRLTDDGYDLSGLTAPMASIYKILSRLAEKPDECKREKEDGRVYYTWIGEEIPF